MLYKKRIAFGGKGKSGGLRTIIALRQEDKMFFVYGFAKNKLENITLKEIAALKKSVVGKALDTLSAAFIAPVDTFKAAISKDKSISDVIKQVEAKPLSEKITATLLTTATIGAGAYGISRVAAGKGAALVSSLIPRTATGKIAAALTLPVAAGAVVGKPELIQEIPKIPAQSFEFAKGIAKGESIIETIKQNPVGAVVVGGLGAIVVGKAVGGVATALTTKEILEKSSSENLPKTRPDGDISTKQIDTNPILPQIPATQRVDTPARVSGGAKRKTYKKLSPSVNQKVNIMISNKNLNSRTYKRYLNREILVY